MATYQQTLIQALETAGCYDSQGRLRSHCHKMRLLLWRLEPHQPAVHIEAVHIEAAFREADCLETVQDKVWVRARCLRLSGMVRRYI